MLGKVLKHIIRPQPKAGRPLRDSRAVPELLKRALAHERGGQIPEAEALYREALATAPGDPGVLHLLGHLCLRLGRYAEATQLLERVAEAAPAPEVYFNLGGAYSGRGRSDDAVRAYERAVELRPEFAAAWNNLALLHKAADRAEQADACYQRLLSLEPGNARAWADYGIFLLHQRRLDAAIDAFRRAVALDPQAHDIRSYLLYALNFHNGYTPEQVSAEHRRWGELHADPLLEEHATPAVDRTPGRKLRIGYLSPNFHDHPVSYFFAPTLCHHDPAAFDIVCYADGTRRDDWTRRLEAYGVWTPTAGMTDGELAALVRRDGIDILVDLTGHTEGHRLLVFARKPAPIQATWNGYANTTGMRAIDWRITDRYADPPGMTEHLHTERLMRLPEIYMAFDPPDPCPPVSALPMLTTGHVTLGSFNVAHKITPPVIAAWAAILREIPRARLILVTVPPGRMRDELVEAFRENGVPGDRLEFVPRLPQADFLALHARVDIALDPFPFNGTTTSCHSLWMGVPFVALAGRTHASRVSTSLLSNLGLHDLVGSDEREYVDIAVRFAQDPGRLASLRAGLRERMRAAPNTDGARLTAHLEAAYGQMWTEYCRRTAL